VTPEEHENDRILTRLSEIKPVLQGWRRGLAIKIIDQCRTGEARKGWQEEGQEIIGHFNAELCRKLGIL